MSLTPVQLDRAVGAVVASAAADALGSQYEFGPAHPDSFTPVFGIGYFGHDVGEWTDDTSMAIPILDALARGESLDEPRVRAGIAKRWVDWAKTSKDVGAQTSAVLSRIPEVFDESDARAAAEAVHMGAGRSGGNGALMRTGPVALGYVAAPASALVPATRALSELTHWEPDSAAACILWSAAIRHAILTGELDVRGQLPLLPADQAARWDMLIGETIGAHPRDFQETNGWVVRAFQGALAAVAGASSLTDAVERAIRGGNDTDTVGAIAGSLAGAVFGASALPTSWTAQLHGWPGYTAGDFAELAERAVLRADRSAG